MIEMSVETDNFSELRNQLHETYDEIFKQYAVQYNKIYINGYIQPLMDNKRRRKLRKFLMTFELFNIELLEIATDEELIALGKQALNNIESE